MRSSAATFEPNLLQASLSAANGSKFLWLSGTILVVSGFVHGCIWLGSSSSWEGSLSWRKPILFGLSGGVTAWSIAWVLGKLRSHRWNTALAWLLGIALLVEVLLVTLQTWRGAASHFNRSTTLDSAIYDAMGVAITLVTILIVGITWQAWDKLNTAADQTLAIRAGLLYLLISCGVGFLITQIGERQMAAGISPEIFGKAGVLKFPHGLALHALQLLPALGWLAGRANLSLKWRIYLQWEAIAGLGILLVFSLLQTFAGRNRGDVNLLTGSILGAGLVLSAVPWGTCLAAIISQQWVPKPKSI